MPRISRAADPPVLAADGTKPQFNPIWRFFLAISLPSTVRIQKSILEIGHFAIQISRPDNVQLIELQDLDTLA